MTRKTKIFLLTFTAVTAGFVIILFLSDHGRIVWAAESKQESKIIQLEPVIPKFKPRITEFTLKDETRCVMVWAPGRAQSSGISCDWQYQKSQPKGTTE